MNIFVHYVFMAVKVSKFLAWQKPWKPFNFKSLAIHENIFPVSDRTPVKGQ